MAYEEAFARRVREALERRAEAVEKKMFGGVAFMVNGHMCCGVNGTDLMVRVGPQRYEEALGRPGARLMDFTGRPLKGFVTVGPAGYGDPRDLQAWVDLGLEFVRSLPAK